ncbi:MAG: hypothetical protein CMH31_03110 [Micavibrio sp.]|nr:hypothetical protein [Micavibrio sp.]|tara:strand:+ start:935 stop:1177 length:243 start_codon:yes stop_codon:yes gene_type:complete
MILNKKDAKNTSAPPFLTNKLGWVKILYKSITYLSVRLFKAGFYLVKLYQPLPSTLSSQAQNDLKSLLFEGFLRKKGSTF